MNKRHGISGLSAYGFCQICALLLGACFEPVEFEGTYQENLPLPEERDFAYKLTLFRFGDEVGGLVRWYDLASFLNTYQNPYVQESYCRYFGPNTLGRDSFGFSLVDGPGGHNYSFQFTTSNNDTIQSRISRGSPVSGESEDLTELTLERISTAASRNCESQARFEVEVVYPRFEYVADDPNHLVGEASNLLVAAVFIGFDEQGRPTRERAVDGFAVSRSSTTWSNRVNLIMPPLPPARGMSSTSLLEEGAVPYGVAHIVLFEDGDRDGSYTNLGAGDRILAVSRDWLIIYIGGQPRHLPATIQSSIANLDRLSPGYSVLSVLESRAATSEDEYLCVVRAVGSGDNWVRLTSVIDEEEPAVPVLFPEELRP